ncbi:MFS transporter [Bacillus cereus group sp. N12]|uniref:MFS transporter n=1 Tax=Bacillus cereus group sp. N12 TaxID=2794586 RepID=UPI0018F71F37|nr:MFS transporter [Bacillus cereus group sp. N12]MBJ8078350.1 MFS transporter [Bacillus cereus group sp. N12]
MSNNNILTDKNFITYLIMAFIIRAGDAIYKIALILYIIKMGGSGSAVGTIVILTILPSVLFGPIAGIFSDRFSSKSIIHIANITRIAALVIVALTSNIILLYFLSFLLSAATLFASPSQKVMLPLLVDKSNITTAAGYLASSRSIIDTLIPIFGSGFAILIGFSETFYLNAALYLISSLLIIPLKLKESTDSPKPKEKLKIFHEISDGFKYLFADKKLKIITFTSIFTLALSAGLDVLIPIYILIDLEFSDTIYGILMGAIGAGITLGGLIIPKIKKKFNLSILFIFGLSIAIDGLSFFFFGIVSNSVVLAIIIMVLCGISSAGFMIMLDSFMQTEVDNQYLGRTYASFFSLNNIFSVIVMGVVSVLADIIKITTIFSVCSLGILVTGIITIYINRVLKKQEIKNQVKIQA